MAFSTSAGVVPMVKLPPATGSSVLNWPRSASGMSAAALPGSGVGVSVGGSMVGVGVSITCTCTTVGLGCGVLVGGRVGVAGSGVAVMIRTSGVCVG